MATDKSSTREDNPSGFPTNRSVTKPVINVNE